MLPSRIIKIFFSIGQSKKYSVICFDADKNSKYYKLIIYYKFIKYVIKKFNENHLKI